MKTLDNAAVALAMIADSTDPIAVAEVGKRLGLPRSSASRLLASLRDGGLIEQDPKTHRYVAGELAWRLGVRFRPVGYDVDLISQFLMDVSIATGFTSWMAVLSGCNVVLLRQHQGNTATQFSVRLGETLPAHATAIGKALLSRLPDRTVQNLFDGKLHKITANTLQTRQLLLEELQHIRERKHSVSNQELFPDVIAIGGALHGPTTNYPIGVSISFPANLDATNRVTELLLSELTQLGQKIGDDYWDKSPS